MPTEPFPSRTYEDWRVLELLGELSGQLELMASADDGATTTLIRSAVPATVLRAELGDVITVPDWSDANNWAAIADPNLVPGIIIAERFGLMPEIFVADQESGFDMLHNDTINLKVRHFLSVFVADYRPLYKANVA